MDIKEIAEEVSKRIYVEDGLLKEVGEPVGYLHQWIEYHPYGDTVAGEPCSAITNDGKPFDKSDTVTLLFTSDQVAAAIESYKAGLLKEVGEPVADGYFYRNPNGVCIECDPKHREEDGVFPLYTSDQLAAALLKATKPLEEEVKAANSECELFRKNGRIVDANKIVELRTNLAAAQEANEHWQRATAENENKWIEANDKLAKAEQRVAEACALQVATETKFHWLDAARVAKEIRSGEWRKFVKEV